MLDRDVMRRLLRDRLLVAGNDIPTKDRINWENRKFTPPPVRSPNDTALSESTWLRESLLWGTERLAANNLLELYSVVQYDVFVPQGTGTEIAERTASVIADKFEVGVTLTPADESVTLVVERTETKKGMESSAGEQVWFQVPVAVTFRAYGVNREA